MTVCLNFSSIKESLPKDDQQVFVIMEELTETEPPHRPYLRSARYSKGNWWGDESKHGSSSIEVKCGNVDPETGEFEVKVGWLVTHWAPMPKLEM